MLGSCQQQRAYRSSRRQRLRAVDRRYGRFPSVERQARQAGRRPPGWRTILSLILAIVEIILFYTLLYKRYATAPFGALPHRGWASALFDAVGTISTIQGPTVGGKSVGCVAMSQELIDLIFFSLVVTLVLGRVLSRLQD
jgi:hypothetical protein